MAIDASAVLTAITDGQSAALAVAMAVAVAWWALRSVKLLRDDGQEYADEDDGDEEYIGTFGSADDVLCSECDGPMALESWEETGGICIHCGAPGGDWFMAPMECEVCGVELPALLDDEWGDHHRIGDHGETLCPACAGDERV